MKIDKGIVSLGLMVLAGIATVAATYLDVQDTLDECRDMYREEIRGMVDEELENRAKAS